MGRPKNRAAVELGRLGGKAGAKRAATLGADRLREIALKAVAAREAKRRGRGPTP